LKLFTPFPRKGKRFRAEVNVRFQHDNLVKKCKVPLNGHHGDGTTSTSDHLNCNPADQDDIDLPQVSGLEYSNEEFEAEDELTTRHYQRLQRAEESWSKLREAMLWATLLNQGSLLQKKCFFIVIPWQIVAVWIVVH